MAESRLACTGGALPVSRPFSRLEYNRWAETIICMRSETYSNSTRHQHLFSFLLSSLIEIRCILSSHIRLESKTAEQSREDLAQQHRLLSPAYHEIQLSIIIYVMLPACLLASLFLSLLIHCRYFAWAIDRSSTRIELHDALSISYHEWQSVWLIGWLAGCSRA